VVAGAETRKTYRNKFMFSPVQPRRLVVCDGVTPVLERFLHLRAGRVAERVFGAKLAGHIKLTKCQLNNREHLGVVARAKRPKHDNNQSSVSTYLIVKVHAQFLVQAVFGGREAFREFDRLVPIGSVEQDQVADYSIHDLVLEGRRIQKKEGTRYKHTDITVTNVRSNFSVVAGQNLYENYKTGYVPGMELGSSLSSVRR